MPDPLPTDSEIAAAADLLCDIPDFPAHVATLCAAARHVPGLRATAERVPVLQSVLERCRRYFRENSISAPQAAALAAEIDAALGEDR